MAIDSQGRLVVGNDGGVWVYDTTASPPVWNDINGNLAITTFNGIAVDPSDPTRAFGGSQDNGTEMFSGNQGWTWVDSGDGGLVHIDPKNPNNVYHVLNGTLQRSTEGGVLGSWTTALDVSFGGLYFPFMLDSVNTSRLLVGANSLEPALQASLDQDDTWTTLLSVGNVTARGA